MHMSRSISMQFNSPAIVPLRADKVDVALYFVDGVRPLDGRTYEERREYVAAELGMSIDDVDELEGHLDEYFAVELHGSRTDREDFRLAISPDEGTWAEMLEDDLAKLSKFITMFGKGKILPMLLQSVNVQSDTGSPVGDVLITEFVKVSETSAEVFRQATEGNQYGHESGGFIEDMMLHDPTLAALTPTAAKKFG